MLCIQFAGIAGLDDFDRNQYLHSKFKLVAALSVSRSAKIMPLRGFVQPTMHRGLMRDKGQG
jgi:hypothetical protein